MGFCCLGGRFFPRVKICKKSHLYVKFTITKSYIPEACSVHINSKFVDSPEGGLRI